MNVASKYTRVSFFNCGQNHSNLIFWGGGREYFLKAQVNPKLLCMQCRYTVCFDGTSLQIERLSK